MTYNFLSKRSMMVRMCLILSMITMFLQSVIYIYSNELAFSIILCIKNPKNRTAQTFLQTSATSAIMINYFTDGQYYPYEAWYYRPCSNTEAIFLLCCSARYTFSKQWSINLLSHFNNHRMHPHKYPNRKFKQTFTNFQCRFLMMQKNNFDCTIRVFQSFY